MTRLALPSAVLLAFALAGDLPAQAPHSQQPPRATRSHAAPLAAFSASASEMRDSIVALARAQIGTPYVFGGTSPKQGFDCSGLVRYLAAALKLELPRTAAQQSHVGRAVAKDPERLRPGDLVTFGSGKRVTHIGIYVGNGKFIHASTTAGKVIESKLIRPRYAGIKPWRGVRRLFLTNADSGIAKGGG